MQGFCEGKSLRRGHFRHIVLQDKCLPGKGHCNGARSDLGRGRAGLATKVVTSKPCNILLLNGEFHGEARTKKPLFMSTIEYDRKGQLL
jgi:hypothetical protein